jgi:hypothetical protein
MALRPTTQTNPTLEPLAVSVAQGAEAAGVSRSVLYQEMATGRLRFAKIGARRIIILEDLRVWLISHRVAS